MNQCAACDREFEPIVDERFEAKWVITSLHEETGLRYVEQYEWVFCSRHARKLRDLLKEFIEQTRAGEAKPEPEPEQQEPLSVDDSVYGEVSKDLDKSRHLSAEMRDVERVLDALSVPTMRPGMEGKARKATLAERVEYLGEQRNQCSQDVERKERILGWVEEALGDRKEGEGSVLDMAKRVVEDKFSWMEKCSETTAQLRELERKMRDRMSLVQDAWSTLDRLVKP